MFSSAVTIVRASFGFSQSWNPTTRSCPVDIPVASSLWNKHVGRHANESNTEQLSICRLPAGYKNDLNPHVIYLIDLVLLLQTSGKKISLVFFRNCRWQFSFTRRSDVVPELNDFGTMLTNFRRAWTQNGFRCTGDVSWNKWDERLKFVLDMKRGTKCSVGLQDRCSR